MGEEVVGGGCVRVAATTTRMRDRESEAVSGEEGREEARSEEG